MKKIIIALVLIAFSYVAPAQPLKIADIKGDYCEFTKISALGREAFILYHQNEMVKLLNDDGTDFKFPKYGSPVPILNAFSEKGWVLKLKYEENRGGNPSTFFLMERKK